MDLEDILLSEVSQTEKQIPYGIIYRWKLKSQTHQNRVKQQSRGAASRGAEEMVFKRPDLQPAVSEPQKPNTQWSG